MSETVSVRGLPERSDRAALGFSPTITDLIRHAGARAPRRPAVVCGPVTLTWGELMARASRLARLLQAQGVGPEVLVGLCVDRSADLITGMLGILLSDGAFVPLLPGDPAARREQQVRESGLRLVVTDQAHRGLLPSDVAVACIDDPVLEALPGTPPVSTATPDSLAYVIFTSGSTGTPKGVAVTHANLAHYTHAIAERLGLDQSGTEPWHFATVSTLAADLGHTSVFPALCSGGVLHVVPDELLLDAAGYRKWIARHRIDLLKVTPTHFQALTGPDLAPEHLPRRWLVLGGEACQWKLVERVLATGPCRVLNHYGPTETTVGACTFEVGGRDVSAWSPATVPIGLPLPNVTALVLDASQQPSPVGVPGELWIGGEGVARGYLGREELTRERFVTRDMVRFYRTGDQVRRLPTGDLEFLGRIDTQVKIRGHRVETAEIELLVAGHPDVTACAVTAPVDASGSPQLLAFVIPRAEAAGLERKILAYVKERLPAHMVPSRIILVRSFPLTPSGKVDRRALSTADAQKLPDSKARARTTLEAVIIRIWEELLPGRIIGPDDDFFDLGGHSLLAARMVDEIAGVIGFTYPLPMLFRAATVRQIADYSVRRVQAEVRPELIQVQAGRPGVTPFFMAHGDYTGGGFYCRWLAEAAGPDQPFYAIPPYVPDGPNRPISIQAMAERFAALVRRAQPHGPYRLGGYCDGGLVAYELARRLRAEGEQVELVLLVDTRLPNVHHRLAYALFSAVCRLTHRDPVPRADRFGFMMERVWGLHEGPRGQRLKYYAGLPGRLIGRRLRRLLGRVHPPRAATPAPVDANGTVPTETMKHHDRARFIYLPGRYDGRVDLLWGAAGAPPPTLRDLGWEGRAREVELAYSAETHITVVTKSLPGMFAAALERLKREKGG